MNVVTEIIQPDHRPARLRDEQPGDHHVRPDALHPDQPAVSAMRSLLSPPLALAWLPRRGHACAAAPRCPTRRCACRTCSTAWATTAPSAPARARRPHRGGGAAACRHRAAVQRGLAPASTAERIVLERPGRPFRGRRRWRPCSAALAVAGVPPDAEVEMPGYMPPMVPRGRPARPRSASSTTTPSPGRFTALLSVTAAGMTPAHARLSGRVVEMVEIPVAAHRLLPATSSAAGDMQIARLHASAVRGEVAQLPAQAVGHGAAPPGRAGRAAAAGRPRAAPAGAARRPGADAARLAGPLASRRRAWRWSAAAWASGAGAERAARAIMEAEVLGAGRVR